MGYVAHAELAAAVSNAGGLGCIGSGSMGSRELREQIRRCRALTDRPFASRYSVCRGQGRPRQQPRSRYTRNVQRCVDVTFEEKVPVIVSGLGNPAGIIGHAHDEGVVVMSLCGNVRQARQLAAAGST